MSIVRTVHILMRCDHSGCPASISLSDPKMAIYKIREEAQRRGWSSTARNTVHPSRDLCPEHRLGVSPARGGQPPEGA